MTEATTNSQAFWFNLNYIICRSFASIFAFFRKYTHFLKARNFFIVYRSTWKCSWRNSWRQKTHGKAHEDEKVVEEMICSQESHSWSHVSPKDIAEGLKISQSSIRRMIKRKGIKQLKLLKTPNMNNATRKRREEHAGCLLEKFETNSQMIGRAVFQDEGDFLLQISINSQNGCVYFKGWKKDVPDENLFRQNNRQSVKLMESAALTWFGLTKPLIIKKELKSERN